MFIISTTLSLYLMYLFLNHYRLVSVHGAAELRQSGATILEIPKLGYALDILRRPLTLTTIVIVPALTMIGREVRHLWRHYARPGYNARLKP